MSTVAYDGVYLAVDSQISDQEGTAKSQINKLWRWKRGYFTVTGALEDFPICKAILEGKKNLRLSKESEGIYTDDGKVFILFRNGMTVEIQPPHAIGTGDNVALALMKAGHSAEEAIKFTCEVDLYSSLPVNYVIVKPTERSGTVAKNTID
jgi:hypothetical protein